MGVINIFSNCANRVTPSATVELNAKVAQLILDGVDVIKLNIGEPDFNTPEHIKKAAKDAINANFTRYTAVQGIPELRQAISKKLESENQVSYKNTEICVTAGAKQAIFEAALVLAQEGDEILLPTPCWVSYEDIIKITGARPVLVPTKTSQDEMFHLDLAAIENAVTPRTKAIIINTPNNPTGVVYTRKELEALVKLAVKYDFWIVSDEVYEKLLYNGAQHISVASLSKQAWERTVTINGCSKTYAMTGWRIGYAAAPQELIKKMQGLQGHITSGISSISQKAAVAAISGSQESVEEMRKEFALRREMMFEKLNQIPGVLCANAQGAFYLLPDISNYFGSSWKEGTIRDSFDMAKYLLEQANIAVVPGASFRAPNCLRLSYSNSMDRLEEGLRRMDAALTALRT